MYRYAAESRAPSFTRHALLSVALGCIVLASPARAADALPSWNEGTNKARIVRFVEDVTDPASRNFVPPAHRIAVFDNDGTLWTEQPMYFQLAFVSDWLATARHPRCKRPYTELTFAPMKEVMAYLRANGFKVFIVSGGGIEFMRVFSERVYGVPPEQVVGSYSKARYEVRDGKPVIVRQPDIDFIDDKAGKPIGIERFIGRRPILAFGNSDGDFEMLEYVTSGLGPRLGLIVHHDDAAREYAYDRKSRIGALERGLDEAPKRGWVVVSIKDDWRAIY